jgi:hypothetical protein
VPSSAVSASMPLVVRGLPTRTTNLMELFQRSIVEATAAAAGCNVSSPAIDNGVDVDITHELPGEDDVMVRVQLKAVTAGWNAGRTAISAKLGRKRYEQMRRVAPRLRRILVAMDLPSSQADWIKQRSPYLIAKHGCYWINLDGAPAFTGNGDDITVPIPASNVFDDVALCHMMARIRAGGAP